MSSTPRMSVTPPRSELRPDRRVRVRRPVLQDQIVPIGFDGDNGGLILDVSQHGCAVQAVGALESGAVIQFDFVLPDGAKRLRGRGEVRWSEKSGRAGLRFLEFSRGSLADLTTWLARPAEAAPAEAASPNRLLDSASVQEQPAPVVDDGALERIARQVRDHTHASGVAIALGPPEAMICRASVGAAPSLGAKLQADSGLSGECVRTGVLVRCDDTETDARVDAGLCRQLDLRSAVLLPILKEKQVVGVLEVFSSVPRAFGSPDIQRLCEVTEQIRSTMFAPSQPEIAAAAPPSSAPVSETMPSPAIGPIAPPVTAVTIAPAAASLIEPLPAPAVATVTVPPPSVVTAPRQAPSVPTPSPRTIPRTRKLTRAERSAAISARQKSEPVAAPTFGVAHATIPRAAKIGFISAIVFILVVGSLMLRGRLQTRPAVHPPAAVTAAPVSTSAPVASEPATQPLPPKLQPKIESKTKSAAAPPAAQLETRDVIAEADSKTIRRPRAEEAAPTPPVLEAAAAAAPNLPAMRAVTPSPAPRASSAPVPGRLVHRVSPTYPAAAYSAHIGGDVVLNAVIRSDGTIGAVEVVKGNPILARAAVEAVRQWRYEPYTLDGMAVEATANIRLTFSTGRGYGVR